MNIVKEMLKSTRLYREYAEYREIKVYWKWVKRGQPAPPPHGVKQGIVREVASRYQCCSFYESGTYLGEMVEAVKDLFTTIYTVELDNALYKQACKRFKKDKHVQIVEGDSGKVLPEIIENKEEPILFWLDGHYSAGMTAQGDEYSPIMKEILPILNHPVKEHVILIDDAREFVGKDGYPDLENFEKSVRDLRPDLSFSVKHDVITIARPI